VCAADPTYGLTISPNGNDGKDVWGLNETISYTALCSPCTGTHNAQFTQAQGLTGGEGANAAWATVSGAKSATGTFTLAAKCPDDGSHGAPSRTFYVVDIAHLAVDGTAVANGATVSVAKAGTGDIAISATLTSHAGSLRAGFMSWTGGSGTSALQRTVSKATSGTTVITCRAGNGTPWSVTVNVVEVVSLLPAAGAEVDDGDQNPDTRLFYLSITVGTPVDVTVRAEPSPNLSEDLLPPTWSLSGGTGTGKLTRTFSSGAANKIVLTCSCGGSSKTTTIYVVAARFRAYAHDSLLPIGHGWWGLQLAPLGAEEILPPPQRPWANATPGYFSRDGQAVGPGELRVDGQGNHPVDVWYSWDVTLTRLTATINYARALDAEPGEYHVVLNNCVVKTKEASARAGVNITTLLDTPPALASFLRSP